MQDRLFASAGPGQKTTMPRPLPGLKAHFGSRFGSSAAMRRFLELILFPCSRAWRYQLNGKTGNTFVLNLLFELEFGQRFTARVSPHETGNQHPDFALFQMVAAGLLSTPLRERDSYAAFREFPGLTLATVRNPYDRALSGYRYLCRSHDLGDQRFLAERLRMNAMVGFDWDSQAGTVAGFDRFLSYLEAYVGELGAEALDPHWRPQALHIRPAILQPDLIGRTEALDRFAAAVADRLERPLLTPPEALRRNQTGGTADLADLYDDPERCRKIERLYAEDFELFDYPLG